MRRAVTASLVAAMATQGGTVAADEATDRLATATSLFEAGQALVRDGRIAEGCAKFEESYRLEPANGTLINLADCYEREGRTATAWLTFREVAGKSARAGQDKRAEVARARAERLKAQLSRLRVTLSPDLPRATEVTRDGLVLGRPSLGVPVPVDPGHHTIEARAPGYQVWRRDVEATKPGVLDVVVPVLEPYGASPGLHGMAIGGIVAMTLGGALAATGLGLGVAAKLEADGADCDAANRCSDEGLQDRSDAVALGNIGTGLGVAGLVVGGAGLVLWFTAPASDLAVGVGPNAARLRLLF